MRTYDNGPGGFTVSFSERDSELWADGWPFSTVEGSGSFSFASNGDLIELGGSAMEGTGYDPQGDWTAFSLDCLRWGQAHIGALRRRHANEVRRAENKERRERDLGDKG